MVVITPGFPEDEADTTCLTSMQHWVSAMREHVNLTVVSMHYPYEERSYAWNGIKVYALGGKNSKWKKILVQRRKLNRVLDQIHREYPISWVHGFWLGENTSWSRDWAKEKEIPFYASAMGQDVKSTNFWLEKIGKLPVGTIFTQSSFQQQVLKQSTGLEAEIIPFGIGGIEVPITRKETDIVLVSSLISLKNVSYLLQVLKALGERSSELAIVVVGDGPERAKLLKEASDFELTRIQWKGELSYTETLEEIAGARILFHASKYESFGMVLAEALYLQAHVLAFPVGLASDEKKIHSLSGNAHDDAALLVRLLNTPQPERITYSIEDTVQAYLKVYI